MNLDSSKRESDLARKVADRAQTLLDWSSEDRRTFFMDVLVCHKNGNQLDLERFLASAEPDFRHDVHGIQRYLDRRTGQLKECFSPRCSAQETVTVRDADLEALLSDPETQLQLEKLLEQNPGGVTKLVTQLYFTFNVEGDDVIFGDEARTRIEAALGVKLRERVYTPNFGLETALDIPEPVRSRVLSFIEQRYETSRTDESAPTKPVR